MPRGDRTGPKGRGPMTGRARGYCAGYDEPGFTDNTYDRELGKGRSRNLGKGFGRGRGLAWKARTFADRFVPDNRSYSKDDEIRNLEEEQKAVEEELSDIRKKLDDLR